MSSSKLPPIPRRALLPLYLILILSQCLLTSCARRVGSNMIAGSHGNYNEVFSTIQQEELLLNLVRRRYLEPTQFTSLGSVSQSRVMTSTLNFGSAFGVGRATGVAGAEGEITDYPSYNLTPQSGPEAAKFLHAQVPLEVIPKLTNAGYPVDLIFTLIAKEVSGLRSIEVTSTGRVVGGSERFMSMLSAINQLEATDRLAISNVLWEEKLFVHPFAPEVFSPADVAEVQGADHGYTSTDDGQSFFVTGRTMQPALWISPEARRSGAGSHLVSMLRLDPNSRKKGWALRNLKFVQGVEFADLPGKVQDHLTLQTRSIHGVLNLMSSGVRVPDFDCQTAYSLNDYREAVNCGRAPDIPSQFVVHFSKQRPTCAFVAIKHRGGWFYIDDTDQSSKNYFNVLFDLYNLAGPDRIEATAGDGAAPVLSFGGL